LKRALAALGIAALAGCSTLPKEQVRPRAAPDRPFSEIVFTDKGDSCALVYKTPRVEVRKRGRILFRIVNDCARATGAITFESFQVDREPVECLNRTRPGAVRPKSERVYPTGVHPTRSVGDRCQFEIHVDGQKVDPEIVIVP